MKRTALSIASGPTLLLLSTCTAPELQPRVAVSVPIVDTRDLVRRLVPDVSERALAALTAASATRVSAAAPIAASPFLATVASIDDAARARECLTAAVYHEARSEPAEGQRAVAQVVLNRVRDRAFPHSVCAVVYQGVGSGKGCQFSFACDGSTRRPRDPDAWTRAERIATAALGGEVMPGVGTATFYHADYVLPWWASSLTRLGAVGRHVFYRWPGTVERALSRGVRYAGVEPGTAVAEAGAPVRSAASFGVTVHRGVATNVSAESEAVPLATRPAALHGVRIHRGEPSPIDDEPVSPAT